MGKDDKFDISIQCAKDWVGGDGMTKTVVSPNICIDKGDSKQAKRVREKITERQARWRFLLFQWSYWNTNVPKGVCFIKIYKIWHFKIYEDT